VKRIEGRARNLRELLDGAKFVVDFDQREYAWQEQQVKELIDDLAPPREPAPHSARMLSSWSRSAQASASACLGSYGKAANRPIVSIELEGPFNHAPLSARRRHT
jgi:hypothetical protein